MHPLLLCHHGTAYTNCENWDGPDSFENVAIDSTLILHMLLQLLPS